MRFCVHCGHALDASQRFCTSCGLANETVPASVANTFPPPTKKGGHKKLVFVLGFLFLLLAAGIGGVVYLGYLAKEKAVAYLHPTKEKQQSKTESNDAATTNANNILGGLLEQLGQASQEQKNPFDNLKFIAKADYDSLRCPAPSSDESLQPIADARIPFVQGLKLTTAWGRPPGDAEAINLIAEIKPESYRMTTSGLTYIDENDMKGKDETNVRNVCATDLKRSYGYVTEDAAYLPPIALDTTQGILSAAAFHDLKSTGKLDAKYLLYFQANDHSGVREHWREGTLSRVSDADVDYPVIVNNDAVKLPTILARGTMLVADKRLQATTENINNRPTPVEIQVLDDAKNPLVLNYSFTNQKFRIQVVKIEYPTTERKIEQALAKEKKAVVYGIYFDFNSDKIKPESKPVMDEIAAALQDNPDWKLSVDGYTDNIGGDRYNLDLSQRRSASVKQALIKQYQIAPDRLTTSGHGNASPIDTNDTLEGRARNRRVELTRP